MPESKFKLEYADRLKSFPPYIFAKLGEEKQKIINTGADVIDLSIGSPNLHTPKEIIDECIKALHDPINAKYPPFGGQPKFKKAVSDWMKRRFNVDVNSSTEVLPLAGAKEGIAHLALAVINPGDITIVPSPYYPVHARGTIMAQGQIYELPLLEKNNYLMDLDSIPEDILKKAKILISSYPNNPTGGVCDLEYMEKLVSLCKKYEILLVSDLAYCELTFDGYVAPSIMQVPGAKDIAIEFHTLSKTYSMAGWRVGFAVGNEEILRALFEVKTNTDYGVCNITQAASVAALYLPKEKINETVQIYKKRRDILVEGLNKLGWNIKAPLGGMYIWFPIPKSYNSCFDFSRALLEKAHVASVPGGSFGTYGSGYVRFALVDDDVRLQEVISRMEKNGFKF